MWPFRREGFAWDRKLCTRLVAFGAPLSLADSGRVAIDLATLYSLGLFADAELVGVYALGLTLARTVELILLGPFHLALYPMFFSSEHREQIHERSAEYLELLLAGGWLLSLLIMIAMEFLLPIIAPEEYAGAYWVMLALLPMLQVKAVLAFSGMFFQRAERTGLVAGVIGGGLAVACSIAALTIPWLGWGGAALASTGGYCFAAGLAVKIATSGLGMRLEVRSVGVPLIGLIVTVGVGAALRVIGSPFMVVWAVGCAGWVAVHYRGRLGGLAT